ncbi:Retrovirus-related Pol polyprotein from transposon 297 [Araneus ventricosus]|uniref:Retrovirus-related Pol polyprotein from transposon 297 n=1 Tax=Araneus ventricosus TaxID=182803 RepID=A0A4Y2MLA8_ARAVE|nr:Retrovirus-related Pol polyprotein from transposon 297 [Araneus ventricosus]
MKERHINPFLDAYVKPGLVNDIEIKFLRYSGSMIDLVSRRYVKPEFYCGENIWVKQPLDEHYISLSLAIVEISREFRKERTKATVFADSLDQERYILGNRTVTLSKTRAVEKEMVEKKSDSSEIIVPDPRQPAYPCTSTPQSEIIVEENGLNKTENAFERHSAERNYSTTEREALAVVWSLNKFRGYVEGSEITVASDHQPLKWLMGLKSPSGQLARWALQLQSSNLKIEYIPGKANVIADMLSRPICTHKKPNCEICTI